MAPNFEAQLEFAGAPKAPDALKIGAGKNPDRKERRRHKNGLAPADRREGRRPGAPFRFRLPEGALSATPNPAALMANMTKMMGAAAGSPGTPAGTGGNPFAAMMKRCKSAGRAATTGAGRRQRARPCGCGQAGLHGQYNA